MSKITSKVYFCPVCNHEEKVSTNHYGEIYSGCKNCKNSVLYCKEAEAKNPDGKCKIVFYSFNMRDCEHNQYHELVKKLEGKGYKMFDAIADTKTFSALEKHNGETIELFNIKQFDNQIVSSIGRVFYWYEAIFPNKSLHSGYYLEFED